MTSNFDYFIVFAEMRTGSNFLETNLNALEGVTCFGEAFNPHFIGYPNKTEILGISQDDREKHPGRLISAIRNVAGTLGGFRFFHDHDPRILDAVLDDPRCAKIILTRNPLDSYVSWKIAQATGQWKLTNVKRRKEARAQFDGEEFSSHVEALQDFQVFLLNRLQCSGQTPFYVAYEDLQSVDIMNGLAHWLGVRGRLEELDQSLKRQNPSPVASKVENPREMERALADLDRFNLSRTPNFEPRRGPAAPSYVLGVSTPLLYMPMQGGPLDEVADWMAGLDGVSTDGLTRGVNQKTIRKWMRDNPGHRRFTVLRHPLARAHAVFCKRILATGPGSFLNIRMTLRNRYKVPLPKEAPDDRYSPDDHRAAFEAFLRFVQLNLSGQTSVRTDAAWGTQAQALSSFADFVQPDLICREDEMADLLPALARQVRHPAPPVPDFSAPDQPISLAGIYDADLEQLCADVYQRDYVTFGFRDWGPPSA